jgi:type II secretory pathway component GspD/PulD (secretin)
MSRIIGSLLLISLLIGSSAIASGRYSREATAQNLDEPPKLQIEVTDAPLTTVLKLIGREMQTNIALSSEFSEINTDDILRITLNYTGNSLQDAVDLICRANDLSWKQLENGSYIISKFQTAAFAVDRQHEVSFQNSEDESAALSVSSGRNLQSLETLETKVRPLLSVDGTAVVNATGILVVRDRPSYIQDIRSYLQIVESRKDQLVFDVKLLKIDHSLSITTPSAVQQYGQLLYQWTSTGLLGTTIPFQKKTRIEKGSKYISDGQTYTTDSSIETGIKLFLTPIKKSTTQSQVSVYAELTEIIGYQVDGRERIPVLQESIINTSALIEHGTEMVVSDSSQKLPGIDSQYVMLIAIHDPETSSDSFKLKTSQMLTTQGIPGVSERELEDTTILPQPKWKDTNCPEPCPTSIKFIDKNNVF